MENEKVCGTCGCFPCMGICPLNDPYAGNQEAEEADYSFNARYDRYDGYDRGDLDYSEDMPPWCEPGAECFGLNLAVAAGHIVWERKCAADDIAQAQARANFLNDDLPF